MVIQKLNRTAVSGLKASCALESPIGVVKELLDNAVDAGATKITVSVDQQTCGLDQIKVEDNGTGIPIDSVAVVCLQHTTSKITAVEDIERCQTLGFRGEALFSIAQLAGEGIKIVSRQKENLAGASWTVNVNGEIMSESLENVACAVGTTVTVKGLFKMFPVRRKILTKIRADNMSQTTTLVKQYVLCFPHIRFDFRKVDSKFQKTIDSQVFLPYEAKFKILGRRVILENKSDLGNGIQVYCLITERESEPSSKHFQTLSINSRVMNLSLGVGRQFNKTIKEVFGDNYQKFNWYFALLISNDKVSIDVNIEPKKDDALIKGFETILDTLHGQLTRLLSSRFSPLSEIGGDPTEILEENTLVDSPDAISLDPAAKLTHETQNNDDTTLISNEEANYDDDVWITSMHERLSSRTNSSNGAGTEYFLSDEDILVSRKLDISNPFTLMKMANNKNNIEPFKGRTKTNTDAFEGRSSSTTSPITTLQTSRNASKPKVLSTVTNIKRNTPESSNIIVKSNKRLRSPQFTERIKVSAKSNGKSAADHGKTAQISHFLKNNRRVKRKPSLLETLGKIIGSTDDISVTRFQTFVKQLNPAKFEPQQSKVDQEDQNLHNLHTIMQYRYSEQYFSYEMYESWFKFNQKRRQTVVEFLGEHIGEQGISLTKEIVNGWYTLY
jgi:DNA mismatch repair protein MutL